MPTAIDRNLFIGSEKKREPLLRRGQRIYCYHPTALACSASKTPRDSVVPGFLVTRLIGVGLPIVLGVLII